MEVVQIAAGWAHCIAVAAGGDAWVWGGNEHGQLGLGDKADRYMPHRLQAPSAGGGAQVGRVLRAAAGHGHSLWLNEAGAVLAAGRNDAGQLGQGDSIDRSAVVAVYVPLRVWCDTPFGSQVSPSYADWVCVGSKIRPQCGTRCRGIQLRQDCGPRNATAGLQVSRRPRFPTM